MRFKFEDLRVWQDALDYGDTAYGLIAQLPASERFDLAEQFRKAATSIALNIAEGRGYRVDSDQLELADQQIAVLFRRLQAFRRSLRES